VQKLLSGTWNPGKKKIKKKKVGGKTEIEIIRGKKLRSQYELGRSKERTEKISQD